MNPRTNYEGADVETARAFVQLFIRHNDCFHFGIDKRGTVDEELRATVMPDDHTDADGNSTINITAINDADGFVTLVDTVRTMGLTVLTEETHEQQHEEIGAYTAKNLLATAESAAVEDQPWNKPHLLVYGSLRPEIEEACYDAFGSQFDFYDVRNHYVIVGEGLNESHRTKLATAVERSASIFEDEKRDLKSSINTSALL